jgi:hypothetical protein
MSLPEKAKSLLEESSKFLANRLVPNRRRFNPRYQGDENRTQYIADNPLFALGVTGRRRHESDIATNFRS